MPRRNIKKLEFLIHDKVYHELTARTYSDIRKQKASQVVLGLTSLNCLLLFFC